MYNKIISAKEVSSLMYKEARRVQKKYGLSEEEIILVVVAGLNPSMLAQFGQRGAQLSRPYGRRRIRRHRSLPRRNSH